VSAQRRFSKNCVSLRGFTLIELLVACLLLSMLITALTMVFNQSSIAWRIGVAGVVNLNETRSDFGKKRDNYDNILPGLVTREDMQFRAVSLWENGVLRTDRAFALAQEQVSYADAQQGKKQNVRDAGSGSSRSMFTVGVRSAGPDGIRGNVDDITTYPEDP
jgi:prepilin-type N-terminal cleavage/methylation domain-containing protein